METRTITISLEIWRKLIKIKTDKALRSYNEVLEILLKKNKLDNKYGEK